MARNITGGFLSIFGGRLGILAISFLTTPLLVRALSPSGYGDYQFLLSVFAVFMIFVSSGVTEGVQKFISERKRYPAWREHVVGFYFLTALGLAAVGAIALAIAAKYGLVGRFVADSSAASFRTYFYLLAALVVAAQFRAFSRRTLMGLELEHYSEPLRVVGKLVWVAVGVGLALLGYGVVGILIGHVVSSLVTALIGFVLVARTVRLRDVFSRPSRGFPYRELLSFNVLNVLLVLLLTSLYKTDVMMIRVFLGGAQTGYYSAALALAEYLWFVPATLQSLFLHSTSSLWSEGRVDAVSDLASRVTRYAVLLTALLAVGIAALAGRFVPLYYGADYMPAVTPLLVLLPGAVGFAIARPLFGLAQGNGDLRPLLAGTGACALVNVVLNAVLIPRWGIAGAAAATSVGYGAMLLVTAIAVRRLGVSPFSDLRPLRLGVTIAVGAAVVFALSRVTPGGAVAFVVVPVGGALAFVILAVLTGAVGLHESATVAAAFPGPIGSIGGRFRDRIETRITTPAAAPSLVPRAVLGLGVSLFVIGMVVTAATGGFAGLGAPANASNGSNATTPINATTTTTPNNTTTATPSTTTTTTTDNTTDNTTTTTDNTTTTTTTSILGGLFGNDTTTTQSSTPTTTQSNTHHSTTQSNNPTTTTSTTSSTTTTTDNNTTTSTPTSTTTATNNNTTTATPTSTATPTPTSTTTSTSSTSSPTTNNASSTTTNNASSTTSNNASSPTTNNTSSTTTNSTSSTSSADLAVPSTLFVAWRSLLVAGVGLVALVGRA